jgi:hypothetical protein
MWMKPMFFMGFFRWRRQVRFIAICRNLVQGRRNCPTIVPTLERICGAGPLKIGWHNFVVVVQRSSHIVTNPRFNRFGGITSPTKVIFSRQPKVPNWIREILNFGRFTISVAVEAADPSRRFLLLHRSAVLYDFYHHNIFDDHPLNQGARDFPNAAIICCRWRLILLKCIS